MHIVSFHKICCPELFTIFLVMTSGTIDISQRKALLFWHKFRCIALNKKEKTFAKKYWLYNFHIWNVWLAFFWWRQQKFFQVNLKLPQTFFVFYLSAANRNLHSKKQFPEKVLCMQNLIFCLHNVVLDTQKLNVFPFLWISFFKQAKNSYLFCLPCSCMPWLMPDNSYIQSLKITIFEFFCQQLKVWWCFSI